MIRLPREAPEEVADISAINKSGGLVWMDVDERKREGAWFFLARVPSC